MKIEKKLIKELVEYLNEFKLTELEYGNSDLKIKVSKRNGETINTIETKNMDAAKKTEIISGTKVTSPIIGTVYLAPEPGGKKFIEIGKKIKKGDTLMIVEAMKTMNHIPSPKDGTISKICIEDGQPVEYGQLLILLN